MSLSVSQRAKLQTIRHSRIPRVEQSVCLDLSPAVVASVDSFSINETFDAIANAIDNGFDAVWRFMRGVLVVALIVSAAWAGVSATMGVLVIFDDARERAAVASYVSTPKTFETKCDYDRERVRRVCQED